MRKSRALPFLVASVAFGLAPAPTPACDVRVETVWDTMDDAVWFGVLKTRCERVPISSEELAAWDATQAEIEREATEEDAESSDEEAPPTGTLRVVEKRALRTFSGTPASIPEGNYLDWTCGAEGQERAQVVAFSEEGWMIPTRLRGQSPSETELDAFESWVEKALGLRQRYGERLNDRHRVEWMVDGAVDVRTRRIAVEEIGDYSMGSRSDRFLSASDKDRILRAFVLRPNVPGTLPGVLGVLRDEPSSVVDLAAVEAMSVELARAEQKTPPDRPWTLFTAMTATLNRLGVPGAPVRVATTLGIPGESPWVALRKLWNTVLCEQGYAPRFECEPEPDPALPDAAPPVRVRDDGDAGEFPAGDR